MSFMLMLLQQLRTPPSLTETRENILDVATGLGFNARSWQPTGMQRTFVEIFARVYAPLAGSIRKIAEGGYNDLAEDVWLHLKSDSDYDNQVHIALATQGTIVLTAAALAPPATINADDLVASTESDITYRNKTGGTLKPGGTLELMFEAEVAGAGGNVAPNTITILKTALAGVTISNPVLPAGTSWITRDGADQETDPELRRRNMTKWATLGMGPALAYVYWAREASASVKRVFVDDTNPRGVATFDIYVAGDSGEVSQNVVDEVDKYLRGLTDSVVRVQKTANAKVIAAKKREVDDAAQVFILKQYDTPANRAAVHAARDAYFKSIPIGGTPLNDGGPGAVRLSALGGAMIARVPGVQNVAFTHLMRDEPLLKHQVAVPTATLEFVQV